MSQKKILLIEDNPDLTFLYKKTLSSLGYDIEHCGSGHSALEKLSEMTPDLIIMDLTLGDLSVEEFHAQFTALNSNRKTPVVLISGREDLMTWARRFEASFVAKKPVDMTRFRKAVQEILIFDEDGDAPAKSSVSPSRI